MQNHPTHDPTAYFAALGDEQQAGRITVAAAAAERAGLLERHLARLAALRAQYLGES